MTDKKNNIWIWFKRTLVFLVSLSVILILLSVLFVRIYEKEIKQFAIKKLNERLEAKVNVKKIELTLFDEFPMASLRFNDVLIEDKLTPNDTLLFAKNIYMNFALTDVINGDYTVQNIKAKHTLLKIKINKKGQGNYSIWKTDTLTSPSKFSFDLNQVVFKDLIFHYNDELTSQSISFASQKMVFAGNFSNSNYQLKTKGKLTQTTVTIDEVNYLNDKNLNLNVAFNVDNNTSIYTIQQGNIEIEKMPLLLSGVYDYNADKPSDIDIDITGKSIKLASVLTTFPKEILTHLHQYKAKGVFDFHTKIKGKSGHKQTPKITIDFSVNNASFTEKNTGVALENIALKGHFSNKNKKSGTKLLLSEITGSLLNNGGNLSGNISLENFTALKFSGNFTGSFDLAVLNEFINNEAIKTLNGKITFDYRIKGNFPNNKNTVNITTTSGSFLLENVNLLTTYNAVTFENISGSVMLNKQDLTVKNLSGKIARSQWLVSASLYRFFPYLFENKPLKINAELKSENIDLSLLLSQIKSQNTASNSDTLQFPKNVTLYVKTKIDTLTYDKFNAYGFKSNIELKNNVLKSKNINFSTSGGKVAFKSEIEQLANNHFIWTGSSTLDNIDVQSFFTSLNNFGQNYLTDKNIKGQARLDIDFAMLYTPGFSLITPSITTKAQLNIKNGELLNQPTLLDLVEYLNSNKIVKKLVDTEMLLQKIKRVKFSEFNHTVLINNEVITFPKTEIKTNVAEINFYGKHSFNNDIDYHFNFDVRQFMRSKEKQDDFGPIQDDGLGKRLFIHIYGNLDKEIKYKLDKKEKKLNKQEIRKQEKQNVKNILKEEFGLFGKDSNLHYTPPTKPQPTFEIESWEENDEEEAEEEIFTSDTKQKKNRKNKWLNRLTDSNTTTTPDISVEFE